MSVHIVYGVLVLAMKLRFDRTRRWNMVQHICFLLISICRCKTIQCYLSSNLSPNTIMKHLISCTEGGGCNGNSAGCQVDNNGDPWSLGSIQAYSGSAHPNGPDKGFRMTYTNGDSAGCPAARRMTVTYTCDEGASKPSLSKVAEPMPCDYTFTMTTKQACPNLSQAGLGGMSLGTLLLILIGVSVVIYIGAGIAINVKKFGKTGVEAFPNLEFWKSIPGLAKDGVMFVVNKVTKRGGSSYQEVEG